MQRLIASIMALLLAAAGAGTFSGCASVPVTGRSQLDLVDHTKVAQMSAEAFAEMKQQYRVSRNKRMNDMLQRVGMRISESLSVWDRPLEEWEWVVFEVPGEVNALAMPGGKVAVFSGAFDVATSDDQLAVIIAHEIAHVTAKHVHERLSQQLIAETGGGALGLMTGGLTGLAVMQAYQLGSGMVGLSFDRKKESEADYIGLIYMARAGYNPRAAIELWEKMDQIVGKSAPPEWLSSHPSHIDRINRLYGWMAEAEAEYEKAKANAAQLP